MGHKCVRVPLSQMDTEIQLFTGLIPNETYIIFHPVLLISKEISIVMFMLEDIYLQLLPKHQQFDFASRV